MCERAGFSGRYTNHSGKVTCATELFAHNVDEQLIMRQTGHRSSAVRAWCSTWYVGFAILQPPKKSKLDDEQCVLPLVYQIVSLWGSVQSNFLKVWTLHSSVRFGTHPSKWKSHMLIVQTRTIHHPTTCL